MSRVWSGARLMRRRATSDQSQFDVNGLIIKTLRLSFISVRARNSHVARCKINGSQPTAIDETDHPENNRPLLHHAFSDQMCAYVGRPMDDWVNKRKTRHRQSSTNWIFNVNYHHGPSGLLCISQAAARVNSIRSGCLPKVRREWEWNVISWLD